MRTKSSVLAEYERLGIKPVSGGSGEDPDGSTTPAPVVTTTPAPESAKPAAFDEAQQSKVSELIAEARAEGRRAAEAAAKKAQDDLEAERKRTDLEKAGEYEEAKKSLVEDLATVTGERDALATKIARYETIAKGQVDSLKKDIPEEALAKFPADGDPPTLGDTRTSKRMPGLRA
jgi:hypothetical protein